MSAKFFSARFCVVCITALGVASPALARNYYPVQNTRTHKCYVLPKKPKSKAVVVLGNNTAFKTRNDARSALATFAACKT
jgi:hypothetical protein